MKIEERLPDFRLVETLLVTAVEAVVQTVFVRKLLSQVEEVPTIVLQGLVVLWIHRIDLSVSRSLAKARADEELAQPVQSLLKGVIRALEVVVSVRQRSKGVVVASIVLDKFCIFVLFGVFLGSLEEHVL